MTLSKKYYKILANLIGTSSDLTNFKIRLENFLIEDNFRFDLDRFEKAVTEAKQQ